MFRAVHSLGGFSECFPHARGDVPDVLRALYQPITFSPRPWGCSEVAGGGDYIPRVFPTPVGMFLEDIEL